MGNGKEMVITAYGHDNAIDKIAVSSFDDSSENDWQYNTESDAHTYCKILNGLELTGGSWINARIIPENTPIALGLFLPLKFFDLIKKIPDRSLQKVFREIDTQELATAFKGCGKAVLEKISRNMSMWAYEMLKDDMESMEPAKKNYDSQDKIISIIKHLKATGEIAINSSWEEDIVL